MSSITWISCIFAALICVAQAKSDGLAFKRKLNDGQEMPTLGLGTFLSFDVSQEDKDAVVKAVETAIVSGYRHIDTASIYNTEEPVGQGVANKIKDGTVKREDLFITTKLWNDKHHREDVVPALRESLQKLNMDYVDLYLIHWPVSYTSDNKIYIVDLSDTWRGMEEAKRLGLARSIGISNFNQKQIQKIWDSAEIKPAALQTELNPTFAQIELVKFAQDKNITLMAYTPFGSMIASRSEKNAPPPAIDDPVLTEIGKKYGKSTTQVVTRYLIQRGLVPLPKSTNAKRIKQNIDVFDFNLTNEEMAQIYKFNKDYKTIKTDGWKDHPEYPYST